MAILKGSLEEEIFTKHQRVIVKAVHKMSQLNEAKTALSKMACFIDMEEKAVSPGSPVNVKVNLINEYFDSEIEKILNSIKLPSRGLKKD